MSEAIPPIPAGPLRRGRWSSDAYRGLKTLLDAPGESAPVAALDWDETCVSGDISYALLDALAAESDSDLWAEYRALVETDRLVAYKALAVLLLKGRTPAEVQAWTRATWSAGCASGRLGPVPEMADLVRVLLERGWQVWVVTGSPTEVVRTLAPDLGIAADRVIGMTTELDASGRFGDRLVEPVTWREGKTLNLELRTGKPATLAAGDSEGDVHLLSSARYAVWVDRGDPDLARLAIERRWWRQEGW